MMGMAGAMPKPARAKDVEELYDGYAENYDEVSGGKLGEAFGFPEMRRELLGMAEGQVLEVAVGTGLNLPFYDARRVKSFTGVDISQGMLDVAAPRVQATLARSGCSTRLVRADASERLADELAGSTFDTVVDTFSLCVIPDPEAALREMRSVLAKGGLRFDAVYDLTTFSARRGTRRARARPRRRGSRARRAPRPRAAPPRRPPPAPREVCSHRSSRRRRHRHPRLWSGPR